jgi:ABC-type multidrug transport system permease subunit
VTSGVTWLLQGFRRMIEVSSAFIKIGYFTTMSYPLSFIVDQLATLAPVFTYYFVAKVIETPSVNVAGDYYTFVIIGVVTARLLAGGLRGLGDELELAVKEGRFESLLVQPVPWRALPFGLVQWTVIWRVVNTAVIVAIAIALGSDFRLEGTPAALLIVVLGIFATMGIGILAAGVKLLAKRTDPIITFYSVAVFVLAGVAYPIELLPRALQIISYLIPETYVIASLRKLLLPGGADLPGPSAPSVILGLLAFNAVVFPLSLWLFGRTLEYGRKTGLLSGY